MTLDLDSIYSPELETGRDIAPAIHLFTPAEDATVQQQVDNLGRNKTVTEPENRYTSP